MASETNSQNRPRSLPAASQPASTNHARNGRWQAFQAGLGRSFNPQVVGSSPADRPPPRVTSTPTVRDAKPDPRGSHRQRYSSEVQQQGRSLAMHRVSWCFSRVLNTRSRQARSWFGTKRPQVQILSPRPVPQVSDLRECRASVACVPLQPPSRRPEGTKKEHEGTLGKAGADFDRQKNTRPPRTTLQTPRHSRVPHGTLILRPQRRGRLVGTPSGQEAGLVISPGRPRG